MTRPHFLEELKRLVCAAIWIRTAIRRFKMTLAPPAIATRQHVLQRGIRTITDTAVLQLCRLSNKIFQISVKTVEAQKNLPASQ